ncbi:ImmA/IrrE family metallo-endopeptidase [Mesorhizobium sp. YIM 152430]|uniref:ImmA/IrrE family metallo-endopeptidase n=1 Tax=Mesorhizobium sp. YIM 152430 TaxID=3031761 RepID=UPI0023DAA13B|nr:ImmA/IrrE family metallo-endopeptidase [Mesorhizobium sp. YIM 152430]MDF1598266.1 ImmA/IrrE family metallo-endopeptidase [Mesorhizobium sp. YIM 152430]
MAMSRDEITVDIIDRFQREYPVDIYGMAQALKIRVVEQDLPDTISGKIEHWWRGDFMITVNSRHSRTRKRFTIAHEIAHYVLHRDLIGEDGITDNALYRDNRIGDIRERQANRYAATLLMPKSLVRRAWNEGVNDHQAMAQAFDVSPAVAEIRLRELGSVFWSRPQDTLLF